MQICAREAIASLSAIIGPLLGGWALVTLGPRAAFGAAAIVQVLSALPFLRTPDVTVKREVEGGFTRALPGVLLFAADGWIVSGYVFAWQIALFITLGGSFSAFGGVLALAALVGAIAGLFLGKHIDAGRGLRAAWLTFTSLAAVTVLRALSTGHVAMAVFANAAGALVVCLYMPTVMTAVYNQAKRSPCPLRFHIATEAGWDIGGAGGCLAIAALSALGVPMPFSILLSLGGSGMGLFLLHRYYAELGIAPAAAAPSVPEPAPSA
jgi:DHA1 family inner membrane transport protein